MQAVLLAAVNSGNRKTWQILLPTFRFGSNISLRFRFPGNQQVAVGCSLEHAVLLQYSLSRIEPVPAGFHGKAGEFPLDKSYYMGLYFLCFHG